MVRVAGNFKNETGKKYGKLKVIRQIESKSQHSRWYCICDCGNSHEATGTSLRSGKVSMCGNCKNEVISKLKTTHGQSNKTPTWNSWSSMNRRCLNPSDRGWYNYGGRGIKICEEWIGEGGFLNFFRDMGERPEGMTLDRIDVNGNYTKENCRWADKKQQSRNVRYNVKFEIEGVEYCVADIAEKLGQPYHKIYHRLITNKEPLDVVMERFKQ